MGGNTGKIPLGTERELYNKYVNHQTATSKASTITILVQQQHEVFRLLVGVPDYSSEVIEINKN